MDAYSAPLAWSAKDCHRSDSTILLGMGYSAYPFAKHSIGYVDFYFEGYVYNKAYKELGEVCVKLLLAKNWPALATLVKECDGEFLMLFYNSQLQKWFVINDSWGRLPVYCSFSDSKVAVSRDMQILKGIGLADVPSRIAMAEYMLFGFNLGTRTFWPGINKLEPHSIVEIDEKTGFANEMHFFQMPVMSTSEKSADRILDALSQAMNDRLNALPSLCLSLSGGLDSRLIAGVLTKAGHQIPARTFVRAGNKSNQDKIGALAIAKSLGWRDYKLYHVAEQSIEDIQGLALLKPGLNNLSMSWILPYLRDIAQNNFSLITGDGGDKFLVDTRPLRKLSSQNKFVAYLIRYHGRSTLKQVSQLSEFSEMELQNHLTAYFKSYATKDFKLAHRHFMFRERAMNWLFEGEDRNRCFAWSTTPYYNPAFIAEAMLFEDGDKAYGRLFRLLFDKLPGDLNAISNPNWNSSLKQRNKIRFLMWRQAVKSYLPLRRRSVVLKNFRFHQLIQTPQAQTDMPYLSQDQSDRYSEIQWYDLLTLLFATKQGVLPD